MHATALHSTAGSHRLTTGRTLDYAAPVYDWLEPLVTLGMDRAIRRRAIELLDLRPHSRVLDVGCGTATLTREIADILVRQGDGNAVGIDAAPAMVAVARRKAAGHPNVHIDLAAAENLPYPDASFDRAVSTLFFHHIDHQFKRRALYELHRVLADDGQAVIVDVTVPTTTWGRFCAWAGYFLFQQPEILENIRGDFLTAMSESPFSHWRTESVLLGYLGVFTLSKAPRRRKENP